MIYAEINTSDDYDQLITVETYVQSFEYIERRTAR
jgi:hypothetical protein